MAKEKDWNIVKYSNDFALRPWGELTAFQQDILACLIVTLRERHVEKIVLSISKLEKLMRRRIKKDRISKQIERMNSVITSIKAEYEDEEVAGEFVVFTGVWREKKTGDIVIDVNPKYMHLFNKLGNKYLAWDLAEHISLPTTYSKTLYRYLSFYAGTGWWYVPVEEFRERMNIPDKYDTRRIMDNVILPSVNILREELPGKFGDLMVERIKEGVRITAFRFAFTPFRNEEDEPW